MSQSGELRFDGRLALVTGGASGLGHAYAALLASRGATVAIADLPSSIERGVASLREAGASVYGFAVDVSNEAQMRTLVRKVLDLSGRCDILVNNAGNALAGGIADATTAMLDLSLRTHLYGSIWALQELLPHMIKAGYGRVVNTASSLGAFGQAGAIPYACAKASIMALTRCAGLELDQVSGDIRVNAVAPVAYTPLAKDMLDSIDVNRDRLSAAAVAPVVAYLAHDRCCMQGETLSAQGGRAARILTAVGPGYVSDALTVEDIAVRTDTILDTAAFRICRDAVDEFSLFP